MVIELGMMTAPPVAPMAGPFGIDHQWPQLFLLTLVAHIALGITMGLLAQHFLEPEDRGWLLPFLLRDESQEQAVARSTEHRSGNAP